MAIGIVDDNADRGPPPLSRPVKNRDAFKLVIVDDSRVVQSALANDIDKMNHILLCAQAFNVPQALRRIDETGAEIVILDMNMPGGSGLEVLKALSENESRPLCIVFSFHLNDAMRDCCTRFGAHACLRKPEDSEVLVAALAAMTRSDLDALRARTLSFERIGSGCVAETANDQA